MSFGGRGGYKPQQSEEEMVMQAMMIKFTLSINRQCFLECVNKFNEDKLTQAESTCI